MAAVASAAAVQRFLEFGGAAVAVNLVRLGELQAQLAALDARLVHRELSLSEYVRTRDGVRKEHRELRGALASLARALGGDVVGEAVVDAALRLNVP